MKAIKSFQINFCVASLLLVTGLLIRLLSDNYVLAAIFIGLAIIESIIALANYRKTRHKA